MSALRKLSEMCKAAAAGGYVYSRGNPRPFEVLADGRLAIDFFAIADTVVELQELFTPRPISEYHEGMGDVLWWKFPIVEPPYCGNPNDCGHTVEMRHYVMVENDEGGFDRDVKTVRTDVGGWPGYHTHWTPLPKVMVP